MAESRVSTGNGATLLVSYLYTISSAGRKLVLTNQFMGYTPTFKATFYTTKTTQSTPADMNNRFNPLGFIGSIYLLRHAWHDRGYSHVKCNGMRVGPEEVQDW
jgi:hypothetical protein